MEEILKPVESITLPKAVADQILGLITEGKLKPGERLPSEQELMKKLKVGRSSVREAIKSLALAGLMEIRHGTGTFVSENYSGFVAEQLNWTALMGNRDIRELIEVRRILEVQTAALAAERATEEQKARLEDLVGKIRESVGEYSKLLEADLAFHLCIAEASQNSLLLRLALSIRQFLKEYLERVSQVRSRTTTEEHLRIFEAIRDSNPQEAREAMAAHLRESEITMMKFVAASGAQLDKDVTEGGADGAENNAEGGLGRST